MADAKRPVFQFGSGEHTGENEATWGTFPAAQTGWMREVLVLGAAHLDFSDATFWKGLGKSDQPEVGAINGERMIMIVRTYVGAYFDKLMGTRVPVLDGPSAIWPEANFYKSHQ